MLWSHLKGKQLSGFKFRRQQGIKSYVVDFYCPQCKLAIEIDGVTHWTEDEIEHDKKRQKEIEDIGIYFLRFTNDEVYCNIDGVLEVIAERMEEITKQMSNGESSPNEIC